MKQLFLVTGNKNKLKEWQQLIPADLTLDSIDLDLPEIQSLDPEEIVADKAKRAFEVTGKSVVTEDVSVELPKLGGLPGPFVKYFLKALGNNALYSLGGGENEAAIVSCAIGYYDGTRLITVRGDIEGHIVSPRGAQGFGFDSTFVPKGHTLTYAEMNADEKNNVSHRQKAIKLFLQTFEGVSQK